jgi:Ala-tRNA(Pro) deacylase
MSGDAMVGAPVTRLSQYLDERGIVHDVKTHDEAMTALAEARESGTPADQTAKGVLLHADDGYRLAVIPASHRLDLKKVRKALGGGEVRFAVEDEMPVVSPGLELGALPPIGPDLPAPEVLDVRLLEHDRIACNPGDHRHSVVLRPGALVDVVQPTVADICQD